MSYEELPWRLPSQFYLARRARTKGPVEFRVLKIPIPPSPIRHVRPKLQNLLPGGCGFPLYFYDRYTSSSPDDRSRHRNRDQHNDNNDPGPCRSFLHEMALLITWSSSDSFALTRPSYWSGSLQCSSDDARAQRPRVHELQAPPVVLVLEEALAIP